MIVKPRVAALIVVRSHTLRDGLQALMVGWPEIDVAIGTNNMSLVLSEGYDRRPTLVVFDGEAAGEHIDHVMQRIRGKWPEAHCIFIGNDVEEQRKAEQAGADVALLTGFPAGDLRRAVMRLLASDRFASQVTARTYNEPFQSSAEF